MTHLTFSAGLVVVAVAAYCWRSRREVLPAFLRSSRSVALASRYAEFAALPAAIGLLLVAAAFSFNLFQLPSNEVALPIEVIGPDGHTVSVQVHATSPSDVEFLYLKAHSIGYPYHLAEGRGYEVDKASIRINDGPWVDVNNSTASCLEPAASARCIDGPMHTIKFRIPISTFGPLNDGANMIHFRFNYAHPSGELGDASTGYRILDVELQTATGTDRIDNTSFSWDTPGQWTAPDGYDSESDVEDGKRLWHQRDILVDGWGGPEITASCADCHVKNGYDLQYFAYSNKSIVQRARFHDLSESQGKKIAAYIRSIQIETEDGTSIDPPGRPWHPPYQPGPTAAGSRAESAPRTSGKPFSALAPVYWAAGAGSPWAMTYDRDIKPYVFPDGLGSAATENLINEKINLREIPVALQMPDWNEWLPTVHPIDVWGSDFTGSQAWANYTKEVPELVRKATDWGQTEKAARAAKLLWSGLEAGGKEFRPRSAPAPYDDATDYGTASLSRMQWGLTKTFEVLHTNHFENDAQAVYGTAAEPLQWLSDSRILFDQPPHIQGPVKGKTSGIMDRYHDAAWYQLQLVINPGSGISTDQKPVDWKYHFPHISAVNKPDAHTWQYIASYVKLIQIAEDLPASYGFSEHHPEGWYLRHMTPALLDRAHHWSDPLRNQPNGGLTDDEYRTVLNALLRAFGDGMTPEPLSEWSRLEDNQYGIEPESAVPRELDRYDFFTYVDHFWTFLRNAGEAGVDYEVLRPLAQWSNNAWPQGDWMGRIEPYKDNPPFDPTSNASPKARIEQPADSTTLPASENFLIASSVSDPDGTVAEVEFFAADSSLGTVSSAPYDRSASLPAGRYALTARATDDDGATTTSSPVDVIVQETDGTGQTGASVARAYYEGTWQRVPDYDAATPLRRDTTAAFSIASPARADHFGYRLTAYLEVSEKGSYRFHLESDDGSKMYVNGSLLIDNGGTHGPEEASGEVTLSEGHHLVVVDYFEDAGGQTLNVAWTPPGSTKGPIPQGRLSPERPRTKATQTVPLRAGWNLVSSRVRPDDATMHTVFGDALDLLVLAKDETGATYSPTYNVTGLDTWAPADGYQVYVKRDTSITLRGQALRSTAPIPLEPGWNMVSYLPPRGMPVEEAFRSLGESLVVVKDYRGHSYIPGRTDDISTVQPTEGYKLYVTEADTLTYPTPTSTSVAPRRQTASSSGSSTGGGTARPNSATILVEAPALAENARIRARADGRVVDRAPLTDGQATLTVRAHHRLSTADATGVKAGERLTFVANEDGTRSPLRVSSATNFLTGRALSSPLPFAKNAVYVVELEAKTREYALSKTRPNPARETTTIQFAVPSPTEVTLAVFNVLGQRVATLVDGSKAAGQHRVEMDVSDLSSGVYFYRLDAGPFKKSRKMTVVK